MEKGVTPEDSIYRTILILVNENLVKYLALKKNPVPDDDLCSVGMIGLIKAIDKYDLNTNNTFATFASICIENEILLSFRKKKPAPVSIEDVAYTNGKGEDILLIDMLEDKDNFVEEVADNDLKKQVVSKIGYLPPFLQYILLSNIGFYEDRLTFDKIAKNLGFSTSYMKRANQKAIKWLKILVADTSNLSEEESLVYVKLINSRYKFLTKEEFEDFPKLYKLKKNKSLPN